MKIEHTSGPNLCPDYYQYKNLMIWAKQKLTFKLKRHLIRGPYKLPLSRMLMKRGIFDKSLDKSIKGVKMYDENTR